MNISPKCPKRKKKKLNSSVFYMKMASWDNSMLRKNALSNCRIALYLSIYYSIFDQGVNPILAMPGFWEHLTPHPLPQSNKNTFTFLSQQYRV